MKIEKRHSSHNQPLSLMNKDDKNSEFLSEENFFGDDESELEYSKSKSFDSDKTKDKEIDSFVLDNPKDYWNNDTEKAVIDFLYLNEFFYDNRIKEEKINAGKQNRKVNRQYCAEMEQRKMDVLQDKERELKREKIFRDKIKLPLQKLVENILFNYRLFVPGVDIKTQERDCYTFLYKKFTNFNPWHKTKSFSYYGTVAKHYYLGNRKDYAKETKLVLSYELNKEEIDSAFLEEDDTIKAQDKSLSLFNYVVKSIEEDLENGNLTKNDQKVGDAIIQIFKNHEIIGVYNKNQIYQLIKDITGLETKDITYSLHRFRVSYKILRQEFNEKDELPLNTTFGEKTNSFSKNISKSQKKIQPTKKKHKTDNGNKKEK